jgi:hypothetical protein
MYSYHLLLSGERNKVNVKYVSEVDEFIKINNINFKVMKEYCDKFHDNNYQTTTELIPYSETDIVLLKNLATRLNKDIYVCNQQLGKDFVQKYVIWISDIKYDIHKLSKFLEMKAFW